MRFPFFLILLVTFATNAEVSLIHKKYSGYETWIDCSKRSLALVSYVVKADYHNEKADREFHFDQSIPEECRQKSTSTYRSPKEASYHRGHMVPYNHMDFSVLAQHESNIMTANILPQTSTLNTGAWLVSEEYVECQRDKLKGDLGESLYGVAVMAGPLYEGEPDNRFMKSHGIQTPTGYFKVAIAGSAYGIDETKAWIMPNSFDATKEMADTYLVSIKEVEKRSGFSWNLPEAEKIKVAKSSYSTVQNCRLD
ncbi:hypothetical protein GOP96_07120 [Vibrio cholerae]|nr:hypothetical protein [Vibrio cholerae]